MGRHRGITEFGRVMRDLAESRGVYGWSAVTEHLQEAGWQGSRATLSNWATGRYGADYQMLPHFVQAFGLNDEEKQRLANAFAYGQGFSLAAVRSA